MTELEKLRAENETMRTLLRDLTCARPLLLYGEHWISEIKAVLEGEPYQSVFPDQS